MSTINNSQNPIISVPTNINTSPLQGLKSNPSDYLTTAISSYNYGIHEILKGSVTYVDKNTQAYPEDNQYIKLNNEGIFSNINNGNNALLMLETLKNLMIKKGLFTESEFKDEYDNTQQLICDIINSKKVANKLTENSTIYYEDC